MQVLKTQNYGNLTFVRTWNIEGIHIGLLKSGGYCHIGGPPIGNKGELKAAIPPGAALDKAINWWEHRDDIKETAKPRKIVIQLDGSYTFDDGSIIESVGDIVSSIPPGAALDAAVAWYTKEYNKFEMSKKREKEIVKAQTEDNLDELGRKQCKAVTELGERCKKRAVDGSNYCNLPAHRKLAQADKDREAAGAMVVPEAAILEQVIPEVEVNEEQ